MYVPRLKSQKPKHIVSRKKKKALPPRVKRMKRSARLQSARSWLPTYSGKNLVAGYRKHFAVDWPCAFKELAMLGVKIDPAYKNHILESIARHIETRKRRKASRDDGSQDFDHDENFAYVAGYTDAGFAYGVTWEQFESGADRTRDRDLGSDMDDIPF